jgi:prepilin-type processing-associated H-X9-DG protein
MDQFAQNPVSQTVAPRTSGLAIASFVMGLVSLTCILWPLVGLPAIICGIIALVKISGSGGMLKGKGYAITGIVIPAVMTIIVPALAMLAAIAFPAVSKAITSQQQIMCLNNEKQITLALFSCANESSGQLPQENWMEVIKEKGLLQNENVLTCPSVMEQAGSYALNKNIKIIKEVKKPAKTVLIFESNLKGSGLGGPDDIVYRHKQGMTEGCNIGFVDGHIEFVARENMGTLYWFPDQQ